MRTNAKVNYTKTILISLLVTFFLFVGAIFLSAASSRNDAINSLRQLEQELALPTPMSRNENNDGAGKGKDADRYTQNITLTYNNPKSVNSFLSSLSKSEWKLIDNAKLSNMTKQTYLSDSYGACITAYSFKSSDEIRVYIASPRDNSCQILVR